MTDWTAYPNFERHEFECKCCGRADMDDGFMERLQALRTRLDFPLTISSGYRCKQHNAAVGGGPAHVTGKAADIACFGGKAREIVAAADQFSGIGINQKGDPRKRFVHLDTLENDEGGAPRPWTWSY